MRLIFAGAESRGVAKGFDESAVFLPNIGNAFTVARGHLGSFVSRAIINDDDLDIFIGLSQRALNTLGQEVCPIISRNRNRDLRHRTKSRG